MKYRWSIKNGSTWFAGTNGDVKFSARGDKAAMQEIELNDPDVADDWERNTTNHGVIDTADLGNILTGTLQKSGNDDWTVETVTITNDEDGRVWECGLNTELTSNSPYRLTFKLVDRGQFDTLEANKRDALDKSRKDAEDRIKAKEDEEADAAAAEEERQAKKALDAEKRKLDIELKKVRQEVELAKARAEIDKLRGASSTPAGSSSGGVVRTIELFAIVGGRSVPLLAGLVNNGGSFALAPGARIMTGDSPGEGFGYGGTPGRWSEAGGGQAPTAYGQDPTVGIVASDGSRVWPMPSTTLEQIFGSGWRAVIT
jgi:hypothetical protein